MSTLNSRMRKINNECSATFRLQTERFDFTTLDILKQEERFKTDTREISAAAPIFIRLEPRNSFRPESLEGRARVIYSTRLE